uniref:Uncharacterized protein n=1 Tax=Calidris pygmaea TaxID=425635 RepID=A0A8C3KQE0_9CHAR
MEDGSSGKSSLQDTSLLLQSSIDDSAFAATSEKVLDLIASLEQCFQLREDDIQQVKSALAHVV